MGARSKARKRAVDVLFEADQRGRPPLEVLAERRLEPGTQAPLPPYAVELVTGVAGRLELLDEAISSLSHGWALDRMPAVDRAVLRIAAWEILYAEVPDAVVVAEAVDLARGLSTADSPSFVNGLLGRLVEIKPTLQT